MRLRFFEDQNVWGELEKRGQILLEHLFETYKLDLEQPRNTSNVSSVAERPKLHKASWFDQLLQDHLSNVSNSAVADELDRYFGNVYPYKPGMSALQWWKVCCLFKLYLWWMANYYL